jgi:hypothetical protein
MYLMTDGLLESFFKNLIRAVVIALAIAICTTATAFVRFSDTVTHLWPLRDYNSSSEINNKGERKRFQWVNYFCRAALVLADISPPAQFSPQVSH